MPKRRPLSIRQRLVTVACLGLGLLYVDVFIGLFGGCSDPVASTVDAGLVDGSIDTGLIDTGIIDSSVNPEDASRDATVTDARVTDGAGVDSSGAADAAGDVAASDASGDVATADAADAAVVADAADAAVAADAADAAVAADAADAAGAAGACTGLVQAGAPVIVTFNASQPPTTGGGAWPSGTYVATAATRYNQTGTAPYDKQITMRFYEENGALKLLRRDDSGLSTFEYRFNVGNHLTSSGVFSFSTGAGTNCTSSQGSGYLLVNPPDGSVETLELTLFQFREVLVKVGP